MEYYLKRKLLQDMKPKQPLTPPKPKDQQQLTGDPDLPHCPPPDRPPPKIQEPGLPSGSSTEVPRPPDRPPTQAMPKAKPPPKEKVQSPPVKAKPEQLIVKAPPADVWSKSPPEEALPHTNLPPSQPKPSNHAHMHTNAGTSPAVRQQ